MTARSSGAIRRPLLSILVAFSLIAVASPVGASDTAQTWPDLLVLVPLGGRWSASGELIARLPEGSGAPAQAEGQARVYRRLSSHLTIGLGYAHVISYRSRAADTVDHQGVQELVWTPAKIGGFEIALRNRLEERVVSGTGEVAWRLREQIRVKRRLAGRVTLSVWSEPFVSLNQTAAAPSTVDQVRSFLGVVLPFGRRLDLEIGYLRQDIPRASGSTTVHAVPMVLTAKF